MHSLLGLMAWVLVGLLLVNNVDTVNITLISFTFLEDDVEADSRYNVFRLMDPSYDVVIRRLKASDPEVFENFTRIAVRCLGPGAHDAEYSDILYGHSDILPDDEVASCYYDFYYKHQYWFTGPLHEQFTIITSPSFKEYPVIDMTSFSAETNSLLALSVSINSFSDIEKHPTTLNIFGIGIDTYVRALALMAQNFTWTGLNIICGAPVRYRLQHVQCSSNSDSNFRNTWEMSVARSIPWTRYDLNQSLVQSDGYKNATNFAPILSDISSKRGTLVLLSPTLLRQFMIAAYYANMTNGDYVFVTFTAIPLQGPVEDIFWVANDSNDKVASTAFRALLIIPDNLESWNGSEQFRQEIADENERRFNWTVDPKDQNIAGAVRTLELMTVFAEAFKNVLPLIQSGQMTLTEFVKSCANRTYRLPTRTVSLSYRGKVISPVIATRVNEKGQVVPFLTCHLKNNSLEYRPSEKWFGLEKVPGEIPACGLHADCWENHVPTLVVWVVAVLLAFTLALVLGLYSRKRILEDHPHPLLERSELIFSLVPDGRPPETITRNRKVDWVPIWESRSVIAS